MLFILLFTKACNANHINLICFIFIIKRLFLSYFSSQKILKIIYKKLDCPVFGFIKLFYCYGSNCPFYGHKYNKEVAL